MAKRTTVVLSQGQSNNPAKRALEETLVTELLMADGADVLVIPHLYDLNPDATALVALQGIAGDFILCSWLYARAAHWILDRNGVRGHVGETAFKSAWDERKKKWEKQTQAHRPAEDTPRVLDQRPLPDRTIYHIDLRLAADAQEYLQEIRRLLALQRLPLVGIAEIAAARPSGNGHSTGRTPGTAPAVPAAVPVSLGDIAIGDKATRRWYPVIDYSRCTNCMECIDFCLFGVYGIDDQETILVEQPDNCRKGCPACSRVCPENAIIFPQHKTPAIAGDPSIGSEMKLDLSQLFGKPNDLDTAAKERDMHLLLAGRGPLGEVAGDSEAPPTRHAPAVKDELDELIDELDELDL